MLDDHQLAADLATRAGALLLEVREQLHAAGAETSVLKDTGDQRSHDFLMSALGQARPGDAILSEEGKDDLARVNAERTWIVDPLDGTREFSEVPRTDWAVHVALVVAGSPIAGAVALPGEDVTLATPTPPPPQPHDPTQPLRAVVSRTRPGPSAENLETKLGVELIPMGSAGAKAMAVVRGQADIYAHTGGQYEWDSCAPVAVATAAGFHTSRIDGSPLVYNNENPYLPDLLICRPELADKVITTLAAELPEA